MLRGAIFDFDGTLFDSMGLWENLGALYLVSRCYTPQDNLAEKLKRMSLQQASCYIKETYEMSESPEEISAGINRLIAEAYQTSILPKVGVRSLMEELERQNVKMIVATATDKQLIEAALIRCEMIEYFDDILTCSAVGAGKDEPTIFRESLRILGTNRRETLVFEDAYHAILTAKQDGFVVAGVYDQYEPRSADVMAASDVYLADFSDTQALWKFALNME